MPLPTVPPRRRTQTGHFSHPISRRELDRSECEGLDAYLQQHRLMQRLRRDAPELEDVAKTKTKARTPLRTNPHPHPPQPKPKHQTQTQTQTQPQRQPQP